MKFALQHNLSGRKKTIGTIHILHLEVPWKFGYVDRNPWGFVLIFHFEALSSYFILRLRPRILFWGFVLIFYIEASSSYFILRLRPRILFWGFFLIFYFEASASYFILSFVLIFYFEASASYFILRLRPHILYWGFVLIFYFEALSSYFILRLRPHILYWALSSYFIWGFVLIFCIEALSSYFSLRLCPHILYGGFILIVFYLRLCSSVWDFGPHCCRPLLLSLYCLFGWFAVVCVWFCLFLFRGTQRGCSSKPLKVIP